MMRFEKVRQSIRLYLLFKAGMNPKLPDCEERLLEELCLPFSISSICLL